MRAARALLLAAALLAACDTRAPSAPPPRPAASAEPSATPAANTLRVAIDPPDDALPQRADTTAEQWIADALFDGLTRWGPDGAPRPAAALEWSSPDAMVWTFTLRQDAVWHDGLPVVAQDFVRGWRALLRQGVMAHLLSGVAGAGQGGEPPPSWGVTAPDSRTLLVRLEAPDATFPLRAGHPALAPLPPSADEAAYERRPVGNGPFAAAEERGEGRFLRLRRAAGWRNGPEPALGELVFQFLDPDTAFLAFQQRRVHVAAVPPGALADAVRIYGDGIDRGPQATLYLLGMDTSRAPFSDPRVRRALAQAIDRTALAAQLLEGNVVPAEGLLPPGLPEAVPWRCVPCAHDPEAARVAFAAAGVRELTLTVSGGGGHEEVARLLATDLAEVGVGLRVEVLAPAEWLPALRAQRVTLYRFGWRPDVPSADAVLRPLLHSASVPRGDGADALRHNHGRYRAADVDRLLDQARAARSAPVRAARYRAADRLAVERDQAVVPLLWFRHRTAVGDDVAGFALDATGLPDWTRVRLRPATAAARPGR